MRNFTDLDFVTLDADGTVASAWNVVGKGDWAADCETGRRYFAELQEITNLVGCEQLVQTVLLAMISSGRVSGIETGFIACLVASRE